MSVAYSSAKTSQRVIVAAMYKFVRLPDDVELRASLLDYCKRQGIKGTILLAEEGINGTVAGSREAIDALMSHLKSDTRLNDLEHKESIHSETPFHRMKVNLKKEIVTMGVRGVDPTQTSGTRVEPRDWNDLITDPDLLLIDTRNQYEYEIGTFNKAVSPETESFTEFPAYVKKHLDPEKHKKVAMFCTGGIRCEKASAYMLSLGFEKVYQLQGGILKYLEEIKPEATLWQGECFVFDGRVAVNGQLKKGSYEQCFACRRPISPEEKKSDKYIEGISCPYCHESLNEKKRSRLEERQKQVELAVARQQKHIGATMPVKNKKQ